MNSRAQTITATLRKVSSGHKVVSFSMDDINHAYSIAKILVNSPEYGRCYCVGIDWEGETIFNIQPGQGQSAPAPYQAPQAPPPPQHYQPLPQHYAPQPQYAQQGQYAPPGYAQPQQFAHPQQLPAYRPAPQRHVIEAQFEENDFGPPPGYPALPGRR